MSEIIATPVFPSMVYTAEKPEFLQDIKDIAEEKLKGKKIENDLYPFRMSDPMEMEDRVQPFARFTATTALDILIDQGYDLNGLNAYFESMWCQEHHKTSGMEQHTHPQVVIVGFYFLDVPENSPVVSFFDPRPGKVALPLQEKKSDTPRLSSNQINVFPSPGLLVFSNSWLPHSVSRNGSDKPFRFIHFNISLTPAPESQEFSVEVI